MKPFEGFETHFRRSSYLKIHSSPQPNLKFCPGPAMNWRSSCDTFYTLYSKIQRLQWWRQLDTSWRCSPSMGSSRQCSFPISSPVLMADGIVGTTLWRQHRMTIRMRIFEFFAVDSNFLSLFASGECSRLTLTMIDFGEFSRSGVTSLSASVAPRVGSKMRRRFRTAHKEILESSQIVWSEKLPSNGNDQYCL